MKRAARTRLVMLAAVATLVALATWQWRHDAARAPGTLLALNPTSVTRVALTLGTAVPRQWTQRDGHWYTNNGQRADDRYVNGLVATAAAPVLEWRALADFAPAKIGLAPAQSVLTLDGHVLRFGAMSATGPQCYVQVGNRVALVSLRYQPRPPAPKHVELH
ncbi:MAG: hypothetical protein EPN56_05460 [Rhodanobacter sp.]|nr:MAG: hypothetical protein EPN78_01355 [Rhodanobacter sp.]TAM15198.1 MAG: hypothetical protein EPN66_00725 [Rhodanobacter sp.]TAM36652.1 MAG: hypothetical protein EPN56_05460 [Rhodanobacter sp.]